MLTYLLNFAGSDQISSGARLSTTETLITVNSAQEIPVSIGDNTVFSIWYQRDSNSVTGEYRVIVGDNPSVVLNSDGYYVATKGWAIQAMSESIRFYSAGGNASNGFGFDWETPVDTDWHHVLIRIHDLLGAFPGRAEVQAWHDGQDLGTKITGGPALYSHSQEISANVELGYVRPVTGIYTLNTARFSGNVAQVWIGSVPADQFRADNWFDSGPVGLGGSGTQGRWSTLPEPWVYDILDWPFESTDQYYEDRGSNGRELGTYRVPVVSDASTGIRYNTNTQAQANVSISVAGGGTNYAPQLNPYEIGYGYSNYTGTVTINSDVYNTLTSGAKTIRVNKNGYYRIRITGSINKNPLTPGSIDLQLRSDYRPNPNGYVTTNTGDIVWNSGELTSGTNSLSADLVVYLKSYIQFTFKVSNNYIEWSTSDFVLEILQA